MSSAPMPNPTAAMQRLAAIGRLTGGVAHDFNNILQVIIANASLVLGNCNKDEKLATYMRRITSAAEHGTAITGRLLTLSRQDHGRDRFEIISAFNSVQELLIPLLPTNIKVCWIIADELDEIGVDVAQFEIVLINLIINARDAMADGGLVTVTANQIMIAQRPWVEVAVIDTGIGMDAELLARVAEPYFTTKPCGHGTGLGLVMAREFVEKSGGSLHIASTLTVGTTIRLILPLAQA